MKLVLLMASFSLVVPLAIGGTRFRHYGLDLKALTIFLCLSLLLESVSVYLWSRSINNLPVLHIFTLVEFVFIWYIFHEHIRTVIPLRVGALFMVLFVAFTITNSLWIQSVFRFNSYARGIEILLILLYCLVYIYTLLTSDNTVLLRRIPMFWFATGALLYYTMSFFLFLLSNDMLIHFPKGTNMISWGLHGVFLVIYHVFLSVALWIHPKP